MIEAELAISLVPTTLSDDTADEEIVETGADASCTPYDKDADGDSDAVRF